MATYTANYGLHQWAAEDNFLRTDFNTDFSKIDAAIKGVSSAAASQAMMVDIKAQRALDALEPVSYNVCQLMLQSHYEGKYTGYKKALIFDGFLDETGISNKSAGVRWYSGQLRLSDRTATQPGSDYGTGVIGLYNSRSTPVFTADGDGWITGFTMYVFNSGTNSSMGVALYINGEQKASAPITVPNTQSGEKTAAWTAVPFRKGDQIHAMASGNDNYSARTSALSAAAVGGYFVIQTPARAAAGTVSRTIPALERTFQGALLWVRHLGGSVGASLGGRNMTSAGLRETQNLQGLPCTETALRLSASLSGSPALTLNLNCGSGGDMTVFDYGVVLL